MQKRSLVAALTTVVLTGMGCQPRPGTSYFYNWPSPANSRLMQPPLPQWLRHFALSQDRKAVAYSAENQSPSELCVATLEGEPRKVAEIDPNVDQLSWSADGQSLFFVDRVERVIPGEYSDFDLPKTEIQEYRLRQLPLNGSTPRTLLSSKERLWFQPAHGGNFLAYWTVQANGEVTSLRRLDLATLRSQEVARGLRLREFALSPDDRSVAMEGYDGSGKPTLTLVTLAAGTAKTLTLENDGQLAWDPLNTLRVFSAVPPGLKVQTISQEGTLVATKTIPVAYRSLLTSGASSLSPDGRRIAAYGEGDSNLVISLATDHVTRLDSFGFIQGWLDDDNLIGAYRGGQHTVTIPKEIRAEQPKGPS